VTLDLATIPGDGIEPEVVEQALCALRTAAHAEGGAEVRITEHPFGAGLPRDRAHPRRRRPRRARSRHSDETAAFALDGARYEIDLSAKNATTLRKALQPFVDHARAVKPAVLTLTRISAQWVGGNLFRACHRADLRRSGPTHANCVSLLW